MPYLKHSLDFTLANLTKDLSTVKNALSRFNMTSNNVISPENSTTVTLAGAGNIFNGSYVNVEIYDTVGVLVSNGSTGTLEVMFSIDGINDDIIYTQTILNVFRGKTKFISNGEYYPYPVIAKFTKIRFTNDNTNTFTRISTNLRSDPGVRGMRGLDVTETEPGIINGIEILLRRTPVDIVRNDIYGESLDIDVAHGEQIIMIGTPFSGSGGDVFASFPTFDSTMIVASTSTDDNPAGIGAIDVLMIGLNSSLEEICEVFCLNGQTSVTTSLVYHRIQELNVLTAGSNLTNVGFITITDSTDSHVLGIPQLRVYNSLSPGTSFSKSSMFTVPKGKILLHVALELNTDIRGDNNKITARLKANNDIAQEVSDLFYFNNNAFVDLSNTRARISGQDLWLTAESNVNNVAIHLKLTTIIADERELGSFTP